MKLFCVKSAAIQPLFIALLYSLSFCSLGMLLIGCSTQAKVKLQGGQAVPQTLAVLPSPYPSGVQKERVDYIRQGVSRELINQGYLVLDDQLVQSICRGVECASRGELATKHGVMAFALVDVGSSSKNDFVAGYYNAIKGMLSITDPAGGTLAQVEHTESERGGLVFNSGQVFQGIISQVNNYDDSRSNFLADRFARNLVSALPRITPTTSSEETESLVITSVDVTSTKGGQSQVCAQSQPGLMASLVTKLVRTGLRETRPGMYCGIFRLDPKRYSLSRLAVEVRSPYGALARKEITAPDKQLCDLQGRVRFVSDNGKNKVLIKCASFEPVITENIGEECGEHKGAHCGHHRLLIYRSTSDTGPFQKVAEVKASSWIDTQAPKGKQAFYSVVSVDTSGGYSVPVPANFEQGGT